MTKDVGGLQLKISEERKKDQAAEMDKIASSFLKTLPAIVMKIEKKKQFLDLCYYHFVSNYDCFLPHL